MSEMNNPGSLEVHVFKEQIPEERVSELRSTRSFNRVYSVGKSYHDLQEGRYYLTIRCGSAAVRFRILTLLIHAEVEPGYGSHGEVCPKQWVHHFYYHGDQNATAEDSTIADSVAPRWLHPATPLPST